MPRWVAPAIAAELWGVSLDVVWSRILADLVPHRTELGFVLVDVDPWAEDGKGRRAEPPATFVPAEQTPPAAPRIQELLESPVATASAVEEDDELPPLDEEESATFTRLSWVEVRRKVARTRRPPPKFQGR